jgi:hypothetical protein
MSDDAITILSKDISDYFVGVTTSAGNAGGTTLIDTALKAKLADWITDYTWVRITSGTCNLEERKVTSLDPSTGTLTFLATSAQILSTVSYEIHRMFSPTDKKQALIQAAKLAYPSIHKKVFDSTKRAGNWLKDGSFEIWTSTSALTNWTASTTTLTKTSTTKLYLHGTYSCKLSGAAGYLGQSITNNDDLKLLRGQSVTFYARGDSDTANSLRLGIYDGITTTYSSYVPAGQWNREDNLWYVTAAISPLATEVAFRVYHDNAAAVEYVDDAYVIGPFYPKVYVADLGLAQNIPTRVSYYPADKLQNEPLPIRDYITQGDYIYLQNNYAGYRLRIEGTGYLAFLKSGVESDAWDATIDIDDPQLRILSAQAACWLYTQMALPNFTTGDRKAFGDSKIYWEQELAKRKIQYGMPVPTVKTNWGI